jgi:predicted RNase H-like HicB family nuclease
MPPMEPQSRQGQVEDLRTVLHCEHCGAAIIRVPLIGCARCGRRLPLRCFTYPSENGYIAECIDLNIVSPGETLDEAIGTLQVAMEGYLDLAFADGPDSAAELIPRLSPFSHRCRYHIARFGHLFSLGKGKHLLPPASETTAYRLALSWRTGQRRTLAP